jgi:hypothetical protein
MQKGDWHFEKEHAHLLGIGWNLEGGHGRRNSEHRSMPTSNPHVDVPWRIRIKAPLYAVWETSEEMVVSIERSLVQNCV